MFTIIEGGTKPHIKTEFSSSADLCAREKVVIGAGETKIIPLGVKIDLKFFETFFNPDGLFFDHARQGDLYSEDEVLKQKWEYEKFLQSHFFELKLRSSLAVKKGLIISNGVGEIDIDYPDEIGLIVHNPIRQNGPYEAELKEDEISASTSYMKFIGNYVTIEAGERVAQIKLMPHKNYLMPDEYKSTEKRTGGFGSTNKSYNDHPETCQCEECQEWQQDYNKRNNTTY